MERPLREFDLMNNYSGPTSLDSQQKDKGLRNRIIGKGSTGYSKHSSKEKRLLCVCVCNICIDVKLLSFFLLSSPFFNLVLGI